MHELRHALLLATVFLLLVPSVSTAQDIPPGNAGADEYTEGVPGAGGNQVPGGPGAGGSGSSGGSGDSQLPPETIDALEQQGAVGAVAAQTLSSTAPPVSGEAPARAGAPQDGPTGADGNGEVSGPGGAQSAAGEGSLGRALGSVVDGSGSGLGIAFPLILAAVALGALGLAAARGRSGDDSTTS